MNHGSAEAVACKVSMLWNWDTIDVCFLASSWQITSGGMMAASCIGTALLVVLLEAVRRASREYDNFLLAQYQRRAAHVFSLAPPSSSSSSQDGSKEGGAEEREGQAPRTLVMRASLLQQLARSVLYGVVFGVTWVVMLIAMSFNGYLIISMTLGAGLGKFLCDWFVATVTEGPIRRSATTESTIDPQQATCCI